MKIHDRTPVAYLPGAHAIEDIILPDGVNCAYGAPVSAKLAKGCIVCFLGEAVELIAHVNSARYRVGEWREISAEDYSDALDCLPPERWEWVGDVSLFRMCEYTAGDITAHYASHAGRYFVCQERLSADYETLAARVREVANA